MLRNARRYHEGGKLLLSPHLLALGVWFEMEFHYVTLAVLELTL